MALGSCANWTLRLLKGLHLQLADDSEPVDEDDAGPNYLEEFGGEAESGSRGSPPLADLIGNLLLILALLLAIVVWGYLQG